jgi:hypothetical protein
VARQSVTEDLEDESKSNLNLEDRIGFGPVNKSVQHMTYDQAVQPLNTSNPNSVQNVTQKCYFLREMYVHDCNQLCSLFLRGRKGRLDPKKT